MKDRTHGIPTAPSAPSSGGSLPGGSSSSGGTSPASGAGGSSGGGGGGGGYGSASWYRSQQSKARKSYLDQAHVMQLQAAALRLALNKTFKHALDIKLENTLRAMRQQDRALMQGYADRVATLQGAATDNAKAASDQSFAALSNAGRERANAMAEAMSQGAGESDVLAAQQMALRNWDANASEIARSNADTLRSINSGLVDLNVDTKTGRANIALQAHADMEQLWTNYYNQRSESLTQLGNVLGQQAQYLDAAAESGGGKKLRGRAKSTGAASGKAFRRAAREAGKAWENPGVPKKLQQWEGVAPIESTVSAAPIGSQLTSVGGRGKPEGATLRRWTV